MTSDEEREARWLRLAGQAAEGTAPSEPALDDEDRQVLDGLGLLARIGTVHSGRPVEFAGLRIRGELGRGGAGRVYRAFDPALQREVALKLVEGRAGLQEARRLARVRHPGVVSVFGASEEDGRTGLWMELIDGVSLEDLLDRQGRLGSREAALVGVEVCRALAAVHAAGLVHGDVTARNVMREEGGRLVLMDFGLGRPAALAAAGGTPPYLAPELLRGEPASPGSDVYALGALLFLLVTGEHALAARSLAEAREAWAGAERRHLRDLRPDLSERFVAAVERALEPSPRRRFASAGALEGALLDVLEVPRQRLWPIAVVALALVLVAVLVRPRAEPAPRAAPVPARLAAAPSPPLRAPSSSGNRVDPFARPLAPAGLDAPAPATGPYSVSASLERGPGLTRVELRASTGLRAHLLAESRRELALLLPGGEPGVLLRGGEPAAIEVHLEPAETLLIAAARAWPSFDVELARLRAPVGARRVMLPGAVVRALRQDLQLPEGPGLAAHAARLGPLVEMTSGPWLRRVDSPGFR